MSNIGSSKHDSKHRISSRRHVGHAGPSIIGQKDGKDYLGSKYQLLVQNEHGMEEELKGGEDEYGDEIDDYENDMDRYFEHGVAPITMEDFFMHWANLETRSLSARSRKD
jgi:hypothetical protein